MMSSFVLSFSRSFPGAPPSAARHAPTQRVTRYPLRFGRSENGRWRMHAPGETGTGFRRANGLQTHLPLPYRIACRRKNGQTVTTFNGKPIVLRDISGAKARRFNEIAGFAVQ